MLFPSNELTFRSCAMDIAPALNSNADAKMHDRSCNYGVRRRNLHIRSDPTSERAALARRFRPRSIVITPRLFRHWE